MQHLAADLWDAKNKRGFQEKRMSISHKDDGDMEEKMQKVEEEYYENEVGSSSILISVGDQWV